MSNSYNGHYAYNRESVIRQAPAVIGIYYCGELNQKGDLIPGYIGRAIGEGVTLRSRLLDHLRDDKHWQGTSHFGFRICSTQQEAKALEESEITRCQPKYNIQMTSATLQALLGKL